MRLSSSFLCVFLISVLCFPISKVNADNNFAKYLSKEDIKHLTSLQTLKTLPIAKTKGTVIEHEGAKIKFLAESNARVSEMTVTNDNGKESKFALKYPISKNDIPEFKREAQILEKVGVPENNNIVQYYGYIEGEGMPILAMELLSAGSLADKPFASSLGYYKQMANGIHQMHRQRYVHGDVKFENAALTIDEKMVRVIDFGSSFKFDLGSYPNDSEDIGTNGFRAAELSFVKGKATPQYLTLKKDENHKTVYTMTNGELYDPTRIDTYAFAMALYRKKYNLTDRDFSFAKMGKKDLPKLKGEEKMDALIKKGLPDDPAQRLSFEDFKSELDSL